jgi:hypothetical protein
MWKFIMQYVGDIFFFGIADYQIDTVQSRNLFGISIHITSDDNYRAFLSASGGTRYYISAGCIGPAGYGTGVDYIKVRLIIEFNSQETCLCQCRSDLFGFILIQPAANRLKSNSFHTAIIQSSNQKIKRRYSRRFLYPD